MRTAGNLLLALCSLAFGLSLCEATLRVFDPRYEYAAGPPLRTYWWSAEYPHPDTGVQHLVAYNNLGSRQHRDFSERDLAEGVNLAFFGDSFTENLRMPAHHSFTEVLDYLLNAGVPESALGRFNVLNFGMDNTGPAEQYLLWRSLAVRSRLRHVFYVHMYNDIFDVMRVVKTGRDLAQKVVWQGYRESQPVVRALSRLHLTYLVLDVWSRLDIKGSRLFGAIPYANALPAFESILRRWRGDVEANGGEFHIVLLPTPDGDKWFRQLESPSSWNVVDLGRCFHEAIPDFRYEDWRFANDRHWNEAANMVAARCLYRDLEGMLGVPERSDLALTSALHAYYHAFQDRDRFGGEAGWTPSPDGLDASAPEGLPGSLADGEADRIVARYQALDRDGTSMRQRIMNAARSSEPVLRSVWNVHASVAERLIIYTKKPCDEPDPAAGMFAQLRPFDLAELTPLKRAKGFHEVNFRAKSTWVRTIPSPRGSECVILVRVSLNPVASVYTGQRSVTGDVLWEGEFPFDDAEDWNRILAHHRRLYRATAQTDLDARSVWDVHASREQRTVTFLKTPCAWSDTTGQFFLRAHGDAPFTTAFSFRRVVDRYAAMFDDRCLLTVPMPAGRFGTVEVGEYSPSHTVHTPTRWQAKFYWDIKGLRRAHASVSRRRADAVGAFAVYRHDDALVYVREPCAEADTSSRFFLHVYAAQAEGGDDPRTNLDFDFHDRGMLFDGKCVALMPLSEAVPNPGAITRLRTGQFSSAGRIWTVELAET